MKIKTDKIFTYEVFLQNDDICFYHGTIIGIVRIIVPCFYGMVDRRKAFSVISSGTIVRDSQISETPKCRLC